MQIKIHSKLITESVAIDSLVLKIGLSRKEPMVPEMWYKERKDGERERVLRTFLDSNLAFFLLPVLQVELTKCGNDRKARPIQ